MLWMETLFTTGSCLVSWEAGRGQAGPLDTPSAGGDPFPPRSPPPGCETGWASAGAWEQYHQRLRALSGAAASWPCAGWTGLDTPGVKNVVSGTIGLEPSAWSHQSAAIGLGLHLGYAPVALWPRAT